MVRWLEAAVFVEAAVARLIPTDALEAGCVLFIDRQLAGSYGRANHLVHAESLARSDGQQEY
jgi:gluconate 2-dehydrogenase gamma chain